MNMKLKTILQQLLKSPRRFPVEAALGVVFFIIAVWNSERSHWNDVTAHIDTLINGEILWLFVPLVILSFWLQRVNRWAYYASFFLFLPLMALNLRPFLWTYGFVFTYVLAGILLIVGNKRMDNRPFAAHALHVVTQLCCGLLIAGILYLAVLAIVASFCYIFGINMPNRLYQHIFQFICFVLTPQVCCTLIRQNEDEVGEPAKVIRLILNFIVSPAIIIYTVILYTYFIKIVFEWDLPKGGVAWLVMGFITVALIGLVAQSILSKRYYDWYYRHFTLIAIPPLIMYWIGAIYRIRLYSFTESRLYLMVAGVLMTLFVLMLWKERTRRYQLMALIVGAAIILFTYIPGISAKDIGLSCQKQRLKEMISELKLNDPKTGMLNDSIDIKSIRRDSVRCEQYREACSVINYVRDDMGFDRFEKQYGTWRLSEYNFNYDKDAEPVVHDHWVEWEKPIDVGEYRWMLPTDRYRCDFDGQVVTITTDDGVTVMKYPVGYLVKKDTLLLQQPERLVTYRNDSLLLILKGVSIVDNDVKGVKQYDFLLFKKY